MEISPPFLCKTQMRCKNKKKTIFNTQKKTWGMFEREFFKTARSETFYKMV